MKEKERTTEVECPRCGSIDDYNFDILSKKTLCTGCRETLYIGEKSTIEKINEILKKRGQIFISRPDGLFEIKDVVEDPEKKKGNLISSMCNLGKKCIAEYKEFEKGLENMGDLDKCSDWEILDVNCLPSDILVGDYEFGYSSKRNNSDLQSDNEYSGWCTIKNTLEVIEELLNSNLDVRYRPTPTKKSHEELAEEYVSEIDLLKLEISSKDSYIKSMEESTKVLHEQINGLNNTVRGYMGLPIINIASRKSMEGNK